MDSVVERANEVKSDYTKLRWAVGLNGALAIAVGVVILLWPGISLFALTILFGAYMAANGVVGLVAAIRGRIKSHRGWLAFAGILSIAAGVAVLVWPNIGELALLYIIGAYAIAFGIIMAGGAFWLPLDGTDRLLLLFSGLVSILFGVVMFADPGDGALVVLALIAAYSLVLGLSEVVLAIGGKRLIEARLNRARKELEAQLRPREPQPTTTA
jgi:uncharacterized membrane protein HdeD (DUF308 family)